MSTNLNEHLPDSLLDKLNKLRALKESAAEVGSHEEAENAASKYYALLLKHNLDEQSVIDHGIQKKAQMLYSEFDLNTYQGKSDGGWVERLIKSVCYFTFCRIVKHPGCNKNDQGYLTILGEKHNVATTFYMVEQLISKINISSKIAFKAYTGYEKRNTFLRGFTIGAVHAIFMRLYKEKEAAIEKSKAEQETNPNSNTNLGLMIVQKDALVQRFMEDKFPNLEYPKRVARHNRKSVDGFIQGNEAGSKMELNRGIGGNGNKTQRGIE